MALPHHPPGEFWISSDSTDQSNQSVTDHYFCKSQYSLDIRTGLIDNTTEILMDQLTARCTKCHTLRDVSWFSFDGRRVSGHTPWCKPCLRAAQRLYRTGVGPGELEKLLHEQDGRCGICGATFGPEHPMRIDRTNGGAVRGLLCARCKVGVNTFQEDVERIRLAAEYLTPKNPPVSVTRKKTKTGIS